MIPTIKTVINFELKLLADWLRHNKLSLNATKTELILFHPPKKKVPKISINFENVKLEPVENVKYLGVTIDEVLSWNKQVSDVFIKLNKANGILSKLRHYTSRSVCLSVYYSLFNSYLLYGLLTWSFTSQINIEKLLKLQKKAIRIITFSDHLAHTNPIFHILNIIKYPDLVKLETYKFLHDFKNDLLPTIFKDFYELSRLGHNHLTRRSENNNFSIPLVKSYQNGLQSLRFKGASMWNHFLNSSNKQLAKITSRKLFIGKIKSLIINEYNDVH